MLIALVASTPAFYDSLMPTPAYWAGWLYVISGMLVLFSAWQEHRLSRKTKSKPADGESTTLWRAQRNVELAAHRGTGHLVPAGDVQQTLV